MPFKESDKVVCVDDEINLWGFENCTFQDLPEKGKVYNVIRGTLFKFNDNPDPVECVYITGLTCIHNASGVEIPWNANAFASIQDVRKNKGWIN